jgi:hypothetical protein
MPFFDVDQEAVNSWASQTLAQNAIVEAATASGRNAANEVRAGRRVDRYGTQWDEVQQRIEEQHPGANLDPDRAREAFQQIRDQSFSQQVLQPPGAGQGERNELGQYLQHVPLARHIYNIQQAGEQRAVRNRIEAGTASQEDYAAYQARLRNERYQADRGNVQSGLESLAQIPAFGAEMLMAGPFASRATAAVGMPLGTGATSLLGRAGQAAPGWLAGEAVRAAAMPANAASSIFQRINPHVGEADASAIDVFHGYLDHQIEIASESLGGPMTEALGGAGRAVGGMIARLPGGARAAAVASGLTQWATNKLGTAGFQNRLRQMGFDGLLGEFLEERVGEVARGLTGVEQDYGMTGGLAAGARSLAIGSPQDRQRFSEALNQLAQEGIAFGGYSAITGLIGTASARQAQRALQGQGLTATQAQAQISQTVTSVLNNPSSVATTPPGPLQQLAQSVAQTISHQAAQGPSPGMEDMPQVIPPVDRTLRAGPDWVQNFERTGQTGGSGVTMSESQETPSVTPGQRQATAEAPAAAQTPTVAPATPTAEQTASPATPTEQPAASTGISASSMTEPTGQISQLAEAQPSPAKAKMQPLADRIDAWREVQDKIKAGEPLTEEEKAVPPVTIEEISKAGNLDPREAKVLADRLSGKSQPDIGKELGVTRERVRQIEGKATKKLELGKSIDKLQTGGKASKVTMAEKTLRLLGMSKEETRSLRDSLQQEVGYLTAGDTKSAPQNIETIIRKIANTKQQAAARQLVAEMVARSKKKGREQEFPAGMEGAGFTKEQQATDAQIKDMARRANSPLTPDEERSKLIDKVIGLILKDKINAANKALRNAGTVGLTEDDYRQIRELSRGQVDLSRPGETKVAGSQVPEAAPPPTTQTERLHAASTAAGAAKSAEDSRPIADIVSGVSAISPHHAAAIAKLRSILLNENRITSEAKAQYLRNQLAILHEMTPAFAALYNGNLKSANFYTSTTDLVNELAKTSQDARDARDAGDEVGGAFNRGTGNLSLDGETHTASAKRVAGHEAGHVIDGPNEDVSNSPDVQHAYAKEALKGIIGEYARTNAHEFLGETMGLILSGEMTPSDLRLKMPLMYEALVSRDLVRKAHGPADFKTPKDIFDHPINDGDLHADTLIRLHVGHDISDDMKKLLAPGSRGPEAAQSGNALRHRLAEADRIGAVNTKETQKAASHFDKAVVNAPSAADRLKNFLETADALEAGTVPNLPANIAPLAQNIRDMVDRDTAALKKRGMLQSWIDNYFGHIWEQPGKTAAQIGAMFGRRPIEGSKAFKRQRTIPTYREGIAKGLVPISWNPVELALMKSREINKAIMAYDLFQEMKQNGLAKFVKTGRRPPDGWVTLNDKMVKVFLRQKVGMSQIGQYYMPEQAGRILNNYLEPGLAGHSKIYDIIREYSNLLNSAQLGFGAFHAGFILMDTQASGSSLALQKLSRGDVKGAAMKAIEGIIPGVAAYTRGKKGIEFWKEYYSPGSGSPEMQAVVKAAVEGGFHLEMNKLVNGDSINQFRKSLAEVRQGNVNKSGSVLWHSLPALSQLISKPTMQYLVPVMKAGVVADLIQHEMEKMPPTATVQERRAAYAKVVDSVDNRLGELAYDNLHLNRTFKDLLMVGLRSVGWNIGTWREIAGGIKDIPKSAYGIYNGKGISPRTAYVGGLVMTAAFYGAMYQFLMTGLWPQEPKDYFFPKTGRRRRDGRPERVSLPSYMRDIAHVMNRADEGPIRIASNAWHMGAGKINPGIASVIEMLNNENFFGQAIYDPRDSFWRQGIDLVTHVGKGLEPFSIRNLHPQSRQIPPDASIITQGFFGITPSPSYIVNSWQQQRNAERERRIATTPLERLRRARQGR